MCVVMQADMRADMCLNTDAGMCACIFNVRAQIPIRSHARRHACVQACRDMHAGMQVCMKVDKQTELRGMRVDMRVDMCGAISLRIYHANLAAGGGQWRRIECVSLVRAAAAVQHVSHALEAHSGFGALSVSPESSF